MGGAASTNRPTGEPTLAQINALPPVVERDGAVLLSVLPLDPELKRRANNLLLEVSKLGFRLLRPGTEDPVFFFPWGQIHSWAHGSGKFTFRYFDDGKKAIQQHNLCLRDVPRLLEHIQTVIDTILEERQSAAISDDAFQALLGQLKQCEPSQQLDYVSSAAKMNFFNADQGKAVLDLLATDFDKVEAAAILHGRLIHQNQFSQMIGTLDITDRDNVWHRINTIKKSASVLRKDGDFF